MNSFLVSEKEKQDLIVGYLSCQTSRASRLRDLVQCMVAQ